MYSFGNQHKLPSGKQISKQASTCRPVLSVCSWQVHYQVPGEERRYFGQGKTKTFFVLSFRRQWSGKIAADWARFKFGRDQETKSSSIIDLTRICDQRIELNGKNLVTNSESRSRKTQTNRHTSRARYTGQKKERQAKETKQKTHTNATTSTYVLEFIFPIWKWHAWYFIM